MNRKGIILEQSVNHALLFSTPMVEQINEQTKSPPKPPSDYIRVKTAYNKLKTARTIEQTAYLYGVTGCGKTELVTHFLGRERYSIYDCKNGHLKVIQETEKGKRQDKRIIIIDNLQFLIDEEDRRCNTPNY